MKVKHSVVSDDTECAELYIIATNACLAAYTSAEEQNASIIAAKDPFKAKLDELIAKAFKLGSKIGKKSADVTDTLMYSDTPATNG